MNDLTKRDQIANALSNLYSPGQDNAHEFDYIAADRVLEIAAQSDSSGTTIYKLRAECLTDTVALIAAVRSNSEGNFKITSIGTMHADCEVEFESTDDFDAIRNLIREIEDGHVMLQTVQPLARYTGERDYDLQ